MAVAGLKDTVTDLFSGNPFATEVGHRVEQATDPKLGSENWAVFMEICDLINENEESAKDAARAIKKRLQIVMQAKDFDAAQLVLTVLETCVKNCGKRFHAIVCSKDYAAELVRLIGVRYEPPVILQERVLGLIQNWAETFRSSPDLHGVTEVYDDLKTKGVEFPVLDLDAMAPIITPQLTVAPTAQPPASARRSSGPAQPPLPQQPQPVTHDPVHAAAAVASFPTGPLVLNPEQLAKLRGDVDVVRGNMQVFTDMLTEMKPGQEDPDDLQLLVDLQTTIRSMQDRIVQLLGSVSNEEVTGELLAINDEMNALFLRYERYERQRKGAATIQTRALPQVPQTTPVQMPEPSTLIDFTEGQASNRHLVDSTQRQMENMSLGHRGPVSGPGQSPRQNNQPDSDNEDFGAFALSRVGHTQPQATVPHSGSSSELPKAEELAEMEKWLKSQPETSMPAHPDRPTLTSSEFDKFLESRAVAADHLPTIPASLGSDQSSQPPKPTSHLLDS